MRRRKRLSTNIKAILFTLGKGRLPRLRAGTLEKIGEVDSGLKHAILSAASFQIYGKGYDDLDDYKKERVWVALEGELK